MKNLNLFLALFLFAVYSSKAQAPGQWTWMGGSAVVNFTGNNGIQGVPSKSNVPPGLYEGCEWTDLSGNFWIYGGFNAKSISGTWGGFDDLWKFDPITMLWTWVKGTHTMDTPAVYGPMGVPTDTSSPGSRQAANTWVDHDGNLWLFGGFGSGSVSLGNGFSDLWKYNIATNQWTWMKGPQYGSVYSNHGVKGVEDIGNTPPKSQDNGISWTGDNNDLWMMDLHGCMWRYNIAANNWIWMKGDTTAYHVYGIKNVPDSNSTPGQMAYNYTRWKDKDGDFWYLDGGWMMLWKYDVSSNVWTWVHGDTTWTGAHFYEEKCEDTDRLNEPFYRYEGRLCWKDNCDHLWLLGGAEQTMPYSMNDLVYYDIGNDTWVWVGDDTTEVDTCVFGTQGIPSPTNMPSSRCGALPFKDLNGNLWLFGGLQPTAFSYNFLSDMWMYTIDTSCAKCNVIAGVNGVSAKKEGIEVYPNPCSSELTVSSGRNINDIVICNMFGQVVYSCHGSARLTITVDVSSLPPEVYLIKVNGEVRRFVKE